MKELLVASFLLTAACTFHSSRQNPTMAALSATEFAQVAFVEKNIDKAFSMLHPDAQAYGTKKKFSQALILMNTPTAPEAVTATDFEPLQGVEGMNIYITGESATETFYYRIPMKGSEEKGYKPAGLFRNQGPYPKSPSRRPL